jgi:glyoxylase-like metal-dependent hydrolase (beta-lactamase superfamily II)
VFSKRYASLDLNIGLVVCPDGLLLVDTRATRAQARQLKEDIREVSRVPVRWVVNTHHHWDHTFGNGEFPDAAIWGHAQCGPTLTENAERMRGEVKRMAPHHAADLDEVTIVPPHHTFTDEITIAFGGRTVQLRHFGPAHTDNDTVVIVPDADVVFAGDLVEESAPPGFGDSYPFQWPAVDRALASIAGGVVVPGHGAPVDAAFVLAQAEELAEVARVASDRNAAGMTPEQAAAEGGPYPERTLIDAFTRAWEQLE